MLEDIGDCRLERGDMTDEQRRQALARIHAKRSFWWHLGAYILGNAALIAIWSFTSGGYFWPIWPALGWGIGLVFHGLGVFLGMRPITEEQIQREIDRGHLS